MIAELMVLSIPIPLMIATIVLLDAVPASIGYGLIWIYQALLVWVFNKDFSRKIQYHESFDAGVAHKIAIGYMKVGSRTKRAFIDFKKAPVWLATGTPGNGKSSLLIGVCRAAATVGRKYKVHTFVLDGKLTGDYEFVEASKGGEFVASRPEEFIPWAEKVKAIIKARYEDRGEISRHWLRTGVMKEWVHDPILVIVDEAVSATQLLNAKEKKIFVEALDYIASQGRQAQVWMLWATQRADAKDMGGARLRENAAGKIAMGPHIGNIAVMTMPEHRKELGQIPDRPGRGKMKIGGGRLIDILVYFGRSPSDPEMSDEERTEFMAQFDDVENAINHSEQYHKAEV